MPLSNKSPSRNGRRRNKLPARIEKRHDQLRLTGRIVRIKSELGYGFIAPDDGGPDYFLHVNSMRDRSAFQEGAPVSFIPGANDGKGRAAPAVDVDVIAAVPSVADLDRVSDDDLQRSRTRSAASQEAR